MLNPFICGNFNHQEDDGEPCSSIPTKKSKRKDNKNPYSARGLDKFSELLADLDARRQKVYSQMSPQEISFVRFTYSNTDDFVPIVVKVRNRDNKKQNKSEELKVRHLTSFSEPMEKKSAVEEKKQLPKSLGSDGFSWNMIKRPSFYVPVVVILILALLTVFGRSVATLCTCVVWYLVPVLSDSSSNSKGWKLGKKKDYVRGLSEKKIVTEEPSNDKSSGKHGHQKSW